MQDPEVPPPLVLAAGLWWYGVWLQIGHVIEIIFFGGSNYNVLLVLEFFDQDR